MLRFKFLAFKTGAMYMPTIWVQQLAFRGSQRVKLSPVDPFPRLILDFPSYLPFIVQEDVGTANSAPPFC